jgi:hypothetical protein
MRSGACDKTVSSSLTGVNQIAVKKQPVDAGKQGANNIRNQHWGKPLIREHVTQGPKTAPLGFERETMMRAFWPFDLEDVQWKAGQLSTSMILGTIFHVLEVSDLVLHRRNSAILVLHEDFDAGV